MFSIQAKRDIVVTGLSVITRKGSGKVLIYTHNGPYDVNSRYSSWTPVYSGSPAVKDLEPFPLDFEEEVEIAAGQTQSFYVYNRKLAYARSNREGSSYKDDNSVVIMEGQVMRGFFRRPNGAGRFAGAVRYRIP